MHVKRQERNTSKSSKGYKVPAPFVRSCVRVLLLLPLLLQAQTLPLEPVHESGASVTGAFEGWFKNPDGSFSLLLGYFNRNTKQEIDIPIGPDNRIEPGGPDRGQPTHFLTGRQWGMFTVQGARRFRERTN